MSICGYIFNHNRGTRIVKTLRIMIFDLLLRRAGLTTLTVFSTSPMCRLTMTVAWKYFV